MKFSVFEAKTSFINIGIWGISDSSIWMENNVLFFVENYCVSLWSYHSCLLSILEYYIALGWYSDSSIFKKNDCFIILCLFTAFVMVNFGGSILAKEFMIVDSENKIVFNGVKQMLTLVSCTSFLIYHNSSTFAIFQSITPWSFFDISNFLIVKIIKLCVSEIIIVVSKIFKPRLVVGDYFPIAFPYFFSNSSGIIFIGHNKIQFICILIIFSKSSCLIDICSFV